RESAPLPGIVKALGGQRGRDAKLFPHAYRGGWQPRRKQDRRDAHRLEGVVQHGACAGAICPHHLPGCLFVDVLVRGPEQPPDFFQRALEVEPVDESFNRRRHLDGNLAEEAILARLRPRTVPTPPRSGRSRSSATCCWFDPSARSSS